MSRESDPIRSTIVESTGMRTPRYMVSDSNLAKPKTDSELLAEMRRSEHLLKIKVDLYLGLVYHCSEDCSLAEVVDELIVRFENLRRSVALHGITNDD